MNAKAVRNSNIEFVRIISIFVIVLSHTVGVGGGGNLSGINTYLTVLQNSIFHAGVSVTCFMFISGFYGIQLSAPRLNKTWSVVWVCSLGSAAIMALCGGIGFGGILKAVFPVISKKYWYASCYVFLVILSPWINRFADSLEKKDFRRFLAVSVILFYVLPTFFYFELMDDKGKGLVHMLICYLIGRYTAKYIEVPKRSQKTLWILLIAATVVTLSGNLTITLVRGKISLPFSRECSVLTLLIGVLVCLIALHGHCKNKTVNKVARYTFHIYLLNNAMIMLARKVYTLNGASCFFMLQAVIEALVISVACGLLAVPLDRIAVLAARMAEKGENASIRMMQKFRAKGN